MNKLETLYTSMNASIALDDFIYSVIFKNYYTSNEMINKEINNSLKLSLIKYMILSLKEEIILKPKGALYTNNLLFSAIDTLVSKVAEQKEDGTVDLNGKIFKDGNTLVAAIRNKIAHGDYTYSDDCEFILFNFDGQSIPVSVNDLSIFAMDMLSKRGEYKNTDEHQKSLSIIPKHKRKLLSGFISDGEMKTLLDSLVHYTFDLIAIDDYIPKEAYIYFDSIKESITKTAKYYRDSSIYELIKKTDECVASFVKYFNDKSINEGWNVELSYNKRVLTEEEKLETIEVFKKIKGKNVKYNDTVGELPLYATRVINKEYNKIICVGKCAQLLGYLIVASENNESNIKDIGEYISSKANNAPIYVDQDSYTIAQIIKLIDLSYLFENYDIDYDLLPLDKIQPTIMNMEDNELEELYVRLDSCEKKLGLNCIEIDSINKQIDGLSNKEMDALLKAQKLKLLTTKLEDVLEKNANLIQIHQETEDYAYELIQDRDDRKKYYYNKFIIERMRDSISHGNVYAIPNGDIGETTVRFEDKYEDKVVFSVDIQLKDLKFMLDDCIKLLSESEDRIRRK